MCGDIYHIVFCTDETTHGLLDSIQTIYVKWWMDFDNPVGIKMAGSKHQREGSALEKEDVL